ncbi:hypothetical protein ACWCOW_40420 [Streptomyces sp. NPDC001939]
MKKRLTMPLAAGALAVAMVGLSTSGAQAKSWSGATVTFAAKGEILTVKDTKKDGRYIYVMGSDRTAHKDITPFCSTRGRSSKTCNYSIPEGHKVNFAVYSYRGSDGNYLGDVPGTA